MGTFGDMKRDDISTNYYNSITNYENGHTQYETLAPENLRSIVIYEKYGTQPVTYERLDENCKRFDGDYKTCNAVSTDYDELTEKASRDDERPYEKLNVNTFDTNSANISKPSEVSVRRTTAKLAVIITLLATFVLAGGLTTTIYFIVSNSEVDDGLAFVDGGFATWSTWSTCTLTCGGGIQTRVRNCSNPTPGHGGADCEGIKYQEQLCNNTSCPVNGGFTMWSEWSACTVTCNGGMQTRSRTCSNPIPAYGGLDCEGEALQEQLCNSDGCSGTGIQGDCWTGSECASCDNGYVGSINGVSVCCQECEKSGLLLRSGYCSCLHNDP